MVLLCLGLGSVSTLVCFVLARVSSFHILSYLMTVSLSGIAKCLFCVETLAFLAERRLLRPFTCCLLTYCKMIVVVVLVVSWL